MSIDIKTIQEAMMSKLATTVPVSEHWTLYVLQLLDSMTLNQAVEATVEHMHDVDEETAENRLTKPEGRPSLIEAYLAELEKEYQTTDNEELWGGDTWDTFRNNKAEALVEAYEEQSDAATDEELFGEDGLGEMVADKIDQLIDAERERLDEMDDDELSEYLASCVNTKNARTQANHVRTQGQLNALDSMFRQEKADLACQKSAK